MKNTPEDLADLRVSTLRAWHAHEREYSKLEKADIFVEEWPYQSPSDGKELERKREISLGISKNFTCSTQLAYSGKPQFHDLLNADLYGSKKTWLIEKTPLTTEEAIRLSKLKTEVFYSFSQARLEDYQKIMDAQFALEMEFTDRRNKAFEKQLISLQEENPDKIIATFRDNSKTSLYHELKRKEANVKAIFPRMPYVRSLQDEILLKRMFRRDVSETEKLRCIPFYLLTNYFLAEESRIIGKLGHIDRYSVYEPIARRICEGLNDKTIEYFALYLKEKLNPRVANPLRAASYLTGKYFCV